MPPSPTPRPSCSLTSCHVSAWLHVLSQLQAEKAALSCSPHPNIIRLHAAFADAQHLYFAMELALGGEVTATRRGL